MKSNLWKVLLLSVALFAIQPAFAGFDEGLAAYKKNDYAAALKEWRPLAARGDAQAQNGLGSMYYSGLGVTQDDQQAVIWFRKAAEQGVAEAQFNLGGMYLAGRGAAQDDRQAADWFRKAAENGVAPAQTQLGLMYYGGMGVAEDVNQAAAWFRKATEQGFTDPRANLEQFGKWFIMTLSTDGKPTSTAVLTDDLTKKVRYAEFSELDAAHNCDLTSVGIIMLFKDAAVSSALPDSGTFTIVLSMNGNKTSYDIPYKTEGNASSRLIFLNGPNYANFHNYMFGVLATTANGIGAEADKREQELEKNSSFSFNFTTKDGNSLSLVFPLEGVSAADLRRVVIAATCGEKHK
ncbi:MAG TPA: tetratricopeptide repeat protein [Novimethylophilus sp.]|jgi:hypothetical protein|uniref:tetratricopeptide repeat protein n=1 Tax=Novimethylophilus sp. TaxID=2137426 RepID=UPI002F3E20F1